MFFYIPDMGEEHAEGLKRLLTETGYCCAQVAPGYTFVFSESQIAGVLREAAVKNIELEALGADLQGEIKRALAITQTQLSSPPRGLVEPEEMSGDPRLNGYPQDRVNHRAGMTVKAMRQTESNIQMLKRGITQKVLV